MPTGSHKKRGTTFCGKLDGELPLLQVRSFKDPPPNTVRNYLLGFRRISGVNILVQKKISAVQRKIGIPVQYAHCLSKDAGNADTVEPRYYVHLAGIFLSNLQGEAFEILDLF